jgi:hypothetical protein
MIPFAISVEDFESDLKKNPELFKTRLIVPYCTIGYRSGKYGSELMKNYGCSNVRYISFIDNIGIFVNVYILLTFCLHVSTVLITILL